jgi:hypothetical protein
MAFPGRSWFVVVKWNGVREEILLRIFSSAGIVNWEGIAWMLPEENGHDKRKVERSWPRPQWMECGAFKTGKDRQNHTQENQRGRPEGRLFKEFFNRR